MSVTPSVVVDAASSAVELWLFVDRRLFALYLDLFAFVSCVYGAVFVSALRLSLLVCASVLSLVPVVVGSSAAGEVEEAFGGMLGFGWRRKRNTGSTEEEYFID